MRNHPLAAAHSCQDFARLASCADAAAALLSVLDGPVADDKRQAALATCSGLVDDLAKDLKKLADKSAPSVEAGPLQNALTDKLNDIDVSVSLLLDMLTYAVDDCEQLGLPAGRIYSVLLVAERLVSEVSQRSLDLHDLLRHSGQQGGGA